MRAITGPGIMPAIRRKARRQGITVSQALIDREMDALRLLLAAGRDLAARERVVTEQELLAGGFLEASGRDLDAVRPAAAGEVSG